MQRWNGWGEEQVRYPLPESAAEYLRRQIGPGQPLPDARLEEILPAVPASRLPEHPAISTDPFERLKHARGQSLPDWVALRSGRIGAFPDGVAYPKNEVETAALLAFARQSGITLIPYGGGTSVVGHINPLPGEAPCLTVDLSHLNELISLDETSRLATAGAGVRGPDLEARLNRRGYTLGHFPQSFELSTLGGWVATRSSGQQSLHYGRIEDLFAGGHVETPAGPLDLPPHPASAAGPDLRQVFLGSEGRLGILTQAVVRVRPLPEFEQFYGVFFKDWESGLHAVREIVQDGIPLSMLRLSSAQETETTLALSGKDDLVKWANRGLSWLGYSAGRCLLVYGITGGKQAAAGARRQAAAILRAHGGLLTGTAAGRIWRRSRFLTPYLRNTLWERGYAIDTLETALPWRSVAGTAAALTGILRGGLNYCGEKVLVFAHLSHVYRDGASIYVTYIFRRTNPDETLLRWQALKTAASQEILRAGGTISHQHGVGLDHAPYLAAEKGPLGMALLQSVQQAVDPNQLLNPGKLLPRPEEWTQAEQA